MASKNTPNVLQFHASLAKFKTVLADRQDAVVKNIMIALALNVVVGGDFGPGTPVDTSFARNSWYVSFDTPGETKVPDELDGTGQSALNEIGLVLVGAKAGGIIYLTNGCAYIRPLEYGWSKQAPAGMVRVVLANAQSLVDAVVKDMMTAGNS